MFMALNYMCGILVQVRLAAGTVSYSKWLNMMLCSKIQKQQYRKTDRNLKVQMTATAAV